MELHQRILGVKSKDDLADFVLALRDDLQNAPSDWENPTLDRFLSAMESWIRDMDGYYKNTGQNIPDTPTWKVFADILYASKMYE